MMDDYTASLSPVEQQASALTNAVLADKSFAEKLLAGDKEAIAKFNAEASKITGIEQPGAPAPFVPADGAAIDLFAPDAADRLPTMVGTAGPDHVTPTMTPREQLADIESWRERGYTDARIAEMNDPDRAYPQYAHERAREIMAAARDNKDFFKGMSSDAIGKMINAAAIVSGGRVVPNGTKTRWTPPGWENPF